MISRREFLRATSAAALTFASSAQIASPTAPILAMGTGTRAWAGESAQTRLGADGFLALLSHAYDAGITHFDLADIYGSHSGIKNLLALGVPRENLTLTTKSLSRAPKLLEQDIVRFRRELGTDYIDCLLLQSVKGEDWATRLAPAMDVLTQAQSDGHIRTYGVACHDLAALRIASIHPWPKVLQARLNPIELGMDRSLDEVVSLLRSARLHGKRVMGVKLLGGGGAPNLLKSSLEFARNANCLDVAVVGFESGEEIDNTFRAMA